ncbi:lipoyl synthase [Candidatus Woesearchaeota archaeon]|nr:lipoyl synthase [Candidatus Woesearchaeota archaeon]
MSRLPDWLRIRPPTNHFGKVKKIIEKNNLSTICSSSLCPNKSECWSNGTATFMIMGDVCTRHCSFCNVKCGKPQPLDAKEPKRLAKAVKELSLKYVVITSVDRDDLEDGGAAHFSKCVSEIKKKNKKILVEALIPDFQKKVELLKKIVASKPDVVSHNIETVSRLQRKARDSRSSYNSSLFVLKKLKELGPNLKTKSSLMLGLGEEEPEVVEAMKDLKSVGVNILTIGQYLQPSPKHLSVKKFVEPQVFEKLKKIGEKIGFSKVLSGPFVRSSYNAKSIFGV